MVKKTIEEVYKKKNQLEHILDLPDTYIGSIEKTEIETWIYNETDNKMNFRNIYYVPGFYKIFDEILVNALDQEVRLRIAGSPNPVTAIKVNFDTVNNMISVYNNGEGIPIEIHKEYNIWIPELIFGHLLTSSNYDKNEKKVTGGKNGYGSKLANIFSKKFIIETVDHNTKKKYIQVFEDNMKTIHPPKITTSNSEPYTKFEFYPDLDKFGLTDFNDDTLALMKKRVIDSTACTSKTVSIHLNDKKLNCSSLEKYVNYYMESSVDKVFEEVNDRWEICVAQSSDSKFEQVSFVNGVCTLKGGKHVDNVSNSIAKKLQQFLSEKGIKRKKIDIKQSHIKDNMFIFIRSTIENPSFDSQTKEYLTTPALKFGSKCEVSEKFVEKLAKTSIVDNAMKLNAFKEGLDADKGKKKTGKIRGIDKLDEANKAGTSEALKCTLILTEGDSAKTLAIDGISEVGRDYFGAYALRGKVLNVRDVPFKKISDNKEISNLVTILGLKYDIGKKKTKTIDEIIKDLRYGRILIFTDQDVDGSHIKGLVMNLFVSFWPQLLELPGFIISLATPIIKVKKSKDIKEFYTLSEFENWKSTLETIKNWDVKYYKGLGTSTSEEGKKYFQDFENKKIEYLLCDNSEETTEETTEEIKKISVDAMELAFDKKRADDRKIWLKSYDRNNIIEQTHKKVLYSEFINKDLIHFSDYDNKRSIPCICDGLKPSLRKIIYSCFKRNLKKEIKVSQLAGYVSENSNYHHGEASLYESIIGLAQNYVGSNNVELLEPIGQFGTRLVGGQDSGAPRYIFTKLAQLTSLLFNPQDNPLLEYNNDDGDKVEPLWYIPILPLILINGTNGIGTGFSSKIPSHNPINIIDNLINIMDDKAFQPMKPYFRGFLGTVDFKDVNEYGIEQYQNKGIYEIISETTVVVKELPIGVWTDNYKNYLESIIIDKNNENKKQYIVDFVNNSTVKVVNFVIKFRQEDLLHYVKSNELITILKLVDSKNTNYSNMHLYTSKGTIAKYDTVEEILKEFYLIRYAFYVKRKIYILKKLKRELNIYESKIRFIREFIDGKINIMNKEDAEVEQILQENDYPKFSTEENDIKNEKPETSNENENESENENEFGSYDYLLNMKMRTLTKNRIQELEKLYEEKSAYSKMLEEKSEKDIWKEELEEFRKCYLKNLAEYNELYEEERNRFETKKKAAPKKKNTKK